MKNLEAASVEHEHRIRLMALLINSYRTKLRTGGGRAKIKQAENVVMAIGTPFDIRMAKTVAIKRELDSAEKEYRQSRRNHVE